MRLSVILLLLTAPALGACPANTNCSWTKIVQWQPAVPATMTVTWRKALGGPIDHTVTNAWATNAGMFEITNGTWYVSITLTAPGMAVTTGTFKCTDDGPCISLAIPGAPTGFQIL